MEGEAEDLDVKVNGIAGEVAFGPAPIGVLDEEAGIGGQNEIACLAFVELESALLGLRSVGDGSQVHKAFWHDEPLTNQSQHVVIWAGLVILPVSNRL